ncbi:MAG: trypsin-like peptidase domain-containing protein [Planctomycetes bacterium]|nr:trypsin-like peptidase domain-containing protein [Planctomycetota bacterium]
MQNSGQVCHSSIRWWALGLAVLALALVGWVVWNRATLFQWRKGEFEGVIPGTQPLIDQPMAQNFLQAQNVGLQPTLPLPAPSPMPYGGAQQLQSGVNQPVYQAPSSVPNNTQPTFAAGSVPTQARAFQQGAQQTLQARLPQQSTQQSTQGGSPQQPAHNYQKSLSDAVSAVLPTVCDIHAISSLRHMLNGKPQAPNTMRFQQPFDGVIDKFHQNRGYENIGAGVMVDERGYILTNYHVVANASSILVTVPGNPAEDLSAQVVAQDISQDLAVIKLQTNRTGYTVAQLGDSSFVQLGDLVLAVGSPFGIAQTVTSGILSGNRRSVRVGAVRYRNLFQTDAPINRGSSGGPLVNLHGEVIGINTAIYAPTGVSNGTGFAVPINEAKAFLGRVLKRRIRANLDRRGIAQTAVPVQPAAVARPQPVRFGLEVVNLDPFKARLFNVSTGGVLVNAVIPNSPAGFAGIDRGDVVISIGGVPVSSIHTIPSLVSGLQTGQNVNVRFVRNGKLDEVLVKVW